MRAIPRSVCKYAVLAIATVLPSFGIGIAQAQPVIGGTPVILETLLVGGNTDDDRELVWSVGKAGASIQGISYDGGKETLFSIALPTSAYPTDIRNIPGVGLVVLDPSNHCFYFISVTDIGSQVVPIRTFSVFGLTSSSTGTMVVDYLNNSFYISVGSGLVQQFTQAQLQSGAKISANGGASTSSAQIPTPAGAAGPPSALNFAIGADGNVWFTETLPTDANGNLIVSGKENIGRLTPDGVITEFLMPTQYPGVGSTDTTTGTYIVAGPDGNVWFTERISGKVGRITPAGVITEFKLPTSATIYGIATGSDGNIWIKDYAGKIYRVTPTGTITSFTIPTKSAGRDVELVPGPDGALWFMEDLAIGRITMAGAITEYPLPTPTVGGTPNYPYQLVFTSNGNGAFTEYTSGNMALLILPGLTNEITSAVEYHNSDFDHYFITPLADEIALLDAAQPPFEAWSRTGFSFSVYVSSNAPDGAVATCRFFNDHFAPKSSHFYAPHGFGCETTITYFPDWTLEYPALFSTLLPDAAGACPTGTIPVYRLYNNGMGAAPNHRFVTSLIERQNMLNKGYVAEGNGIGVSMCVPP
jgi:hypothetical protein